VTTVAGVAEVRFVEVRWVAEEVMERAERTSVGGVTFM